jgi:hypothetical protein
MKRPHSCVDSFSAADLGMTTAGYQQHRRCSLGGTDLITLPLEFCKRVFVSNTNERILAHSGCI